MKLTIIELQELRDNIYKCNNVINSCENIEQLKNASNYTSLLNLMYWNKIESKGYASLFSEDTLLIRREFNKLNKNIKKAGYKLTK